MISNITQSPQLFAGFPDLLTVEDLQAALGIGRSMAYRLINDGSIGHMRVGRSIKIPKKFVVDFIDKMCYNDGCDDVVAVMGGKII